MVNGLPTLYTTSMFIGVGVWGFYVGLLGEGFLNPGYHRFGQFIWNNFDKFRTTPTVSVTGLRLVL